MDEPVLILQNCTVEYYTILITAVVGTGWVALGRTRVAAGWLLRTAISWNRALLAKAGWLAVAGTWFRSNRVAGSGAAGRISGTRNARRVTSAWKAGGVSGAGNAGRISGWDWHLLRSSEARTTAAWFRVTADGFWWLVRWNALNWVSGTWRRVRWRRLWLECWTRLWVRWVWWRWLRVCGRGLWVAWRGLWFADGRWVTTGSSNAASTTGWCGRVFGLSFVGHFGGVTVFPVGHVFNDLQTTIWQHNSVFAADLVSVAGGLVVVVGAIVVIFDGVVEVVWHSRNVWLLQMVELQHKNEISLDSRRLKQFLN